MSRRKTARVAHAPCTPVCIEREIAPRGAGCQRRETRGLRPASCSGGRARRRWTRAPRLRAERSCPRARRSPGPRRAPFRRCLRRSCSGPARRSASATAAASRRLDGRRDRQRAEWHTPFEGHLRGDLLRLELHRAGIVCLKRRLEVEARHGDGSDRHRLRCERGQLWLRAPTPTSRVRARRRNSRARSSWLSQRIAKALASSPRASR